MQVIETGNIKLWIRDMDIANRVDFTFIGTDKPSHIWFVAV